MQQMSVEYCQLDGYNFEDDYFNLLISPVPKQENVNLNIRLEDSQEMNTAIQIPKIENPNKSSNRNNNNNSPQSKTTKRKNSESKEFIIKEEEEEEDTEISSSPLKKSKKSGKAAKKKKETPKRKRVNYCFEIHRSGCSLNKDAKLYCKVFLKGKLQSEVDLIKGARGKWAYTFYDQRKKKKERRYWPSQSSGPVIEDSCSCDKCVPNSTSHDEEVDFSSPSTEEATFIEYDNTNNQVPKELQQPLHQYEYQQMMCHYAPVDQNQPVYLNKMHMTNNYHNNEQLYEQYNQYIAFKSNEYQKNILKSSIDFQDRNPYFKTSNDLINHQRTWDNYFHSSNIPIDYGNDGFFSVENNFL